MRLARALPSGPLTGSDITEIRARNEITAFTVLGTTSIRAHRRRQETPATAAVALVDGTVCALEFDGSDWSREVLRHDADRQEYLEAALQWSTE